jgi:phage gp45-like
VPNGLAVVAWLVAVGSLFCASSTAFAQSSGTVGVLIGAVLDAADHKPIKDAVVTATSPALQGEQVVVTDASGFYRIPGLPAGEYALQFEADGHKPVTRGGIALRSGATLRLDVDVLPVTLTAEEVKVEAKAPTVDVGSSTIVTTIDQKFTQRIAVAAPGNKGSANRSFEAVAEVAPGAQPDTYGTSIAGTTSPENGYLVDGMDVGNPGFGVIGTPLTTEFIEETNVISGGYMPEYGRTTGGILDAVTKSGSNEFHGGFFSFITPGGLQGRPKVVQPAVGAVVGIPDTLSYLGDVGADIGGPIIKDKLWFYTGFDLSRSDYHPNRAFYREVPGPNGQVAFQSDGVTPVIQPVEIPGSYQQFDALNTRLQAIGKLTWAVNERNKVTLTAVASPSSSGGPGKFAVDPLTDAPETSSNQFPDGTLGSLAHQLNSSAYDLTAKWSTEFDNKRLLVDTAIGWHHQNDSILPSDGTQIGSGQGLSAIPGILWGQASPYPYHGVNEFETFPNSSQCIPPKGSNVNTLCPVPVYYSGGAYGGQYTDLEVDNYNRYTLGSTVTYLLQAWGHHVIKAGVSFDYSSWNHTKGHSGGDVLQEQANGVLNDAEQFGYLSGPDDAHNIEPFNLTTQSIIAGAFVQDSWAIKDLVTLNVGLRYDIQNMYGGDGQLGLTLPNEWSPRVGVIYDPTQQGRAKIFANYARYYENVPLGLADGALTGEPNILANHDPTLCGTPGTPGYCQNNASRTNPGNPTFAGTPNAVPGTPTNPPQLASQLWHGSGGAETVDPGIQPTSSDELVAGAEYELIKDSRMGISYTRRWLNRWIEDFSPDGGATFLLGNPGYGLGNYLPKAQRNYDAGTIYFDKTFGDDWLTSASYTISYLRGNVDGLFNVQGELDINHNADFDVPAFVTNSYGPLQADHTHDIKIFGAKDWVIDRRNRFSTGLSLRASSGNPINYTGNDAIFGYQYYLLPRGSQGRLPWNYDVDTNIGYRFNFDKDKSILVTVDIFNLFNFQQVVSVNEQYTAQTAIPSKNGGTLRDVVVSTTGTAQGPYRPLLTTDKDPNFGLPNGFQSPRVFRFGVRGTF